MNTLVLTDTVSASPAPAPTVAIARPVNLLVKRSFDLVASVTALVILLPVFAAVMALVKLTDPSGPVFYRQNRVGRNGQPIGVLKFRSMLWAYSTGPNRPFTNAVDAFRAMGREDLCAEFEIAQKVANDPRISRFGAFLRKSSLDELPQLINVLLGHISLVGPRPIIPAELERYGSAGAHYLAVKPGITGLWQISGRSDTGYDERVSLDVRYVRTWNLVLDLIILVKTVRTVLIREGAY